MISEVSQEKRLKNFDINIKTKFLDGNKKLERNTDSSLNNNIHSGIILEKDYYRKGQLLKKENIFDSRILYSYEFDGNKDITCSNCGMHGDIDEFNDGCPYCHTSYNIEYDNKEFGSKHYYDLVTRSNGYVVKTFIIDYIVSFIFTFFLVYYTSRTFHYFEIIKIIVISILISLLLFYVFYYLDAAIIMPSVRRKKERQNKIQEEFWRKMLSNGFDKVKFYNNFVYDLRNLYYGEKYNDVVDFDILDYEEFELYEKDNSFYVNVLVSIRIVRYVDGKIKSSLKKIKYTLLHQDLDGEINGGVNLIKCRNCGSSVNVADNKCSYCGTKYNYYQEWYIVGDK